jgi:glutamine synthetase
LAIAASLACGYLGMKEALEPDPPMTGSAYDSKGHALPNNYWVGLDNMKNSQPIRNVLGDDFVSLYVSLKEYEYDDFDRKITPWEREHLLLSV